MSESKRHLVVLAGDEGGRTPVFFRPMIQYALDAAERAGAPSPAVAAGEEAALRAAAAAPEDGTVLVVPAEAVLLSPDSLRGLAAAHAASGSACTEARAEGVPEPAARCFRAGDMAEALRRGARGFAEAARALGAAEYRLLDPDEALRAGEFYGLCRVEAVMRRRHNAALARAGVDLLEPATTLIDPRCRIEAGVRIDGCCTVVDSVLERGVMLERLCRVVGSEIGQGSRLRRGTCAESAFVGRGCRAGPYASLRPGSRLRDGAGLGTFAELRTAGRAFTSGRA